MATPSLILAETFVDGWTSSVTLDLRSYRMWKAERTQSDNNPVPMLGLDLGELACEHFEMPMPHF